MAHDLRPSHASLTSPKATGPRPGRQTRGPQGGRGAPESIPCTTPRDRRPLLLQVALSAQLATAPEWRELGPANTSGRIVDVAVDPRDREVRTSRRPRGGLWKTANAGTTFAPVFIALRRSRWAPSPSPRAPRKPFWLGTGEPNARNSVSRATALRLARRRRDLHPPRPEASRSRSAASRCTPPTRTSCSSPHAVASGGRTRRARRLPHDGRRPHLEARARRRFRHGRRRSALLLPTPSVPTPQPGRGGATASTATTPPCASAGARASGAPTTRVPHGSV